MMRVSRRAGEGPSSATERRRNNVRPLSALIAAGSGGRHVSSSIATTADRTSLQRGLDMWLAASQRRQAKRAKPALQFTQIVLPNRPVVHHVSCTSAIIGRRGAQPVRPLWFRRLEAFEEVVELP